MELSDSRSFGGRWLIGGALIALGIVLVLMNIGVIGHVRIWNYWPLIFVAIGANKIIEPYKRSEGFWWLALGLWFLVNTLRLWGLHWRDTWPAVLVILGITWMWESFERESRRKAQTTQHQSTLSS
jgi:hypothetical protein